MPLDTNPTVTMLALGQLTARLIELGGTDNGTTQGCTRSPDLFLCHRPREQVLKNIAWKAHAFLELPEISKRRANRREAFPCSFRRGLLCIVSFEQSRKTQTFFSEQITGHVSFSRDILVTDVFV